MVRAVEVARVLSVCDALEPTSVWLESHEHQIWRTAFQDLQNPGGYDPSSVCADDFDDCSASTWERSATYGSHGHIIAHMSTTVSVCASAKMDKSSTTAREYRVFIVGDGEHLRKGRSACGGMGERCCSLSLLSVAVRHARQMTLS